MSLSPSDGFVHSSPYTISSSSRARRKFDRVVNGRSGRVLRRTGNSSCASPAVGATAATTWFSTERWVPSPFRTVASGGRAPSGRLVTFGGVSAELFKCTCRTSAAATCGCWVNAAAGTAAAEDCDGSAVEAAASAAACGIGSSFAVEASASAVACGSGSSFAVAAAVFDLSVTVRHESDEVYVGSCRRMSPTPKEVSCRALIRGRLSCRAASWARR